MVIICFPYHLKPLDSCVCGWPSQERNNCIAAISNSGRRLSLEHVDVCRFALHRFDDLAWFGRPQICSTDSFNLFDLLRLSAGVSFCPVLLSVRGRAARVLAWYVNFCVLGCRCRIVRCSSCFINFIGGSRRRETNVTRFGGARDMQMCSGTGLEYPKAREHQWLKPYRKLQVVLAFAAEVFNRKLRSCRNENRDWPVGYRLRRAWVVGRQILLPSSPKEAIAELMAQMVQQQELLCSHVAQHLPG